MSAVCVCKHPSPTGEGTREHCTKCGAWTSAAIAAHYARQDGRCEFCGSAKHTLADCTLNGVRLFRAEMGHG